MAAYFRVALSVAAIFSFSILTAQVKVQVTNGSISEYNMAVSSISASEDADIGLAKNITEAIDMTLDITGYFKVLDPKSFLEKADIPVSEINFKNWMNVGANGLIKGTIKGKDNVELELFFFSVADGKLLLTKKYKSSSNTIKKAAYRFVNEVITLLTGENFSFMFSKIAFVEKTGDLYSLVTVDFDGSDRKVIFSEKKIILLPEWSADGRKIFFTSYENNNPNLYSIDVKTKQKKLVSSHEGLNTSASAHPDNKTIALRLSKDGNAEIYLMNTETGELARITKNMAIDTAPSISPDGKEIAFVSNRSGNPQIYRLWIDNPGKVERITEQGKYNQDPDYSPNGKYIVFTGRDEFFTFDIFLFDLSSRMISRLTQNQGKNESPSFSPDSKMIVFSSDRNGKNALFISNVKGDKQVMVYVGEGVAVSPSWSAEVVK